MTEVLCSRSLLFPDASIVIGIPCYNEASAIAKIILQLKSITDEIIVCDDGSIDMTGEIAHALGCKVITHTRNVGKGAALRDLFLAAREKRCDVFVTIDGDGQHEVKDIPRLVSAVLDGNCDIAIGSRFEHPNDTEDMPAYRMMGSRILNSIVRRTSNVTVKDTQSGLRAYNKNALSRITPGEEGLAVDTEILALAASKGMKIQEYAAKIRYEGLETSSQNPVNHSIEVIGGTIKFVSLRHPLKFYGIPATALFFLSVVLGTYTTLSFANTGHLPFGPALLTVSAFIVSVILGAVAVILYSLTTLLRQNL